MFSSDWLSASTKACEHNLLRLILGPLPGSILLYLIYHLVLYLFDKILIFSHPDSLRYRIVKLFLILLGCSLFYLTPQNGSVIILYVFILFIIRAYFLFLPENQKLYRKIESTFARYRLSFLLPKPPSLKIILLSFLSLCLLESYIAILGVHSDIPFLKAPLLALLLNTLLIIALFVDLSFIFRNMVSSLIAVTGLLWVFFTYHAAKVMHWNAPMEIYDVYLFPQLIPFLRDVGRDFLVPTLIVFSTFILIIGYAIYWRKKSKKKIFLKQLIPLFITVHAMILCLFLFKNTVRAIDKSIVYSIISLKQPQKSGLLYFLFAQVLCEWYLSPPEEYSLGTIQNLYNKFKKTDSIYNKGQKEPVDLVVYVGESFWDPQAIENFQVIPDPIAFFHKIKKEGISGSLAIPVVSGNSVQTEFEILTSLSTRFTTSIAYLKDVKKTLLSALPAFLNSHKYKTFFLHNDIPRFNQKNVLPLLGFEQITFMNKFKNTSYAGRFIADVVLIEEMIQRMEQAEAPFLVYGVGMVSHNPYDSDYLPISYKIIGEYDETRIEEFKVHSNLIHEVDKALEKLVTYLSTRQGKTILVFFGDHLPNFVGSIKYFQASDSEGQSRKYMSPFLIWANFPIPKKKMTISANFLIPLVLSLMPIERSAYYQSIEAIRIKMPVIARNFIRSQGMFITNENLLTKEEKEIMKYYRILQYDVLHGKQFITSLE